jgi:hypothetical protein
MSCVYTLICIRKEKCYTIAILKRNSGLSLRLEHGAGEETAAQL